MSTMTTLTFEDAIGQADARFRGARVSVHFGRVDGDVEADFAGILLGVAWADEDSMPGVLLRFDRGHVTIERHRFESAEWNAVSDWPPAVRELQIRLTDGLRVVLSDDHSPA